MFDFGFSEMLLVGGVALVVLGPERLPVVARTAGEWIGKMQRFVAQVKSDINRETDLGELRRLRDEAQSLADEVRSTVQTSAAEIEAEVRSVAGEAQEAVKGIEEEAQSAVSSVKQASDDIASFYGWNSENTYVEEQTWKDPKTFERRYQPGPTVDELSEELVRLRRELGMRETRTGTRNRLAVRSRSNRVRIYR